MELSSDALIERPVLSQTMVKIVKRGTDIIKVVARRTGLERDVDSNLSLVHEKHKTTAGCQTLLHIISHTTSTQQGFPSPV